MQELSTTDERGPDRRARRVQLLLLAIAALQTVDVLTLHRLMTTTGVWIERAALPGAPVWLGSNDSALLVRLGTLAVCLGGLYAARRNWLAELGAFGVLVISILLLARWSVYLDLIERLPTS